MLRGARFRDVRLDGEEGEAGWVGFRVRGSQVVMPLARLARFARRYVLDKALCSSRAPCARYDLENLFFYKV